MDELSFKVFFNEVLQSIIPAISRDKIIRYWRRFEVNPEFFLTDNEITILERQYGKAIPYAGIRGSPCLHRFGFRLSFFQNAPKSIYRTLIQHELIHIEHISDQTPTAYLQSRLQQSLSQTPSKIFRDPVSDALKKIAEAKLEQLDEYAVMLTNQQWGGNEDELRNWIILNEQKRNQKS